MGLWPTEGNKNWDAPLLAAFARSGSVDMSEAEGAGIPPAVTEAEPHKR